MTVEQLIKDLQELVASLPAAAGFEVRDREGSTIDWTEFDVESGVVTVLPSPFIEDAP